MSDLFLYSVYDVTAGEFGPPFTASSDPVAIRQYLQMMDNVLDFVYDDFRLVKLGSWLPYKPLEEQPVGDLFPTPVVIPVSRKAKKS